MAEKNFRKHKNRGDDPIRVYCDEKSTISITYNPVQQYRSKHIEIDKYFIKEKLNSSLTFTPYIPISSQLAYVLNKDLSNPTFRTIIGKLRMNNI